MDMSPQMSGMSPPQTQAQAPSMSPQRTQTQRLDVLLQQMRAQAQQSQGPEKMFIQSDGSRFPESQLADKWERAMAMAKQQKLTREVHHELLWVTQQHYPKHPFLGGQSWVPPPGTKHEVLRVLRERGGLGMGGGQMGGQQMGQAAVQQQQTGQPQWPNSRSPSMIPANMGQAGGQQAGQPARQPMWPNSSPNMIPVQYRQTAQGRQILGRLTIDPTMANAALERTANYMGQSPAQAPSARSQGPASSAVPCSPAMGSSPQAPSQVPTYFQGYQCTQSARSPSQAPSQGATAHSYLTPAPSFRAPSTTPYGQNDRASSQTPQQYANQANSAGFRPPSTTPYGQTVRSPSQPSPFKANEAFAANPHGPNFRPSPAPTPPQDAGTNLSVPRPRKGSAPEIGMFPPPLSRSPSFSGNAPSSIPPQLANAAIFMENMTPEQRAQVSPRKAAKLEKKWNEWQESVKRNEEMKAMQPPPRPGSTTGDSKKRKAPSSSIPRPKPKRQHTVIDLAAHRESQIRRQGEEPNCGFGPSTTVFRSNPNSRQTSPQPGYAPRVFQAQAAEEMADEDLHEHVMIHGVRMSDVEYNTNIPAMRTKMGLHHNHLRKLHASLLPSPSPSLTQTSSHPRQVAPEPSILAAIQKVKSGKFDFSRDDGYVYGDGVPEHVLEMCTRDEDGGVRARKAGVSEESANLEFGMLCAKV
jgi:hypothetical protein